MNKDQVAVYLNEHLEFFNEYPELLRKIQEIKELRRQNRVGYYGTKQDGKYIPETENPLYDHPEYGVSKFKTTLDREVEFQRILDEDLEDVTMGQQDARKWMALEKKKVEADKEVKLIEGELEKLKSAFEDDVKHREVPTGSLVQESDDLGMSAKPVKDVDSEKQQFGRNYTTSGTSKKCRLVQRRPHAHQD